MDRRLAAILAADVVGYSRLVGIDETGTIAAMKRYRTEIFDPKIAQYRGRTVKMMGDGTLIEFPSVVDAVTCAVEVQILMRRHNDEIPEDRRVDFRIGINLGDVIVEADDLYGDGVNVSARLEGLAEPGGICLSRSARDQIRDRLDLDLADLGEIEVKNIARPLDSGLDLPHVTAVAPDTVQHLAQVAEGLNQRRHGQGGEVVMAQAYVGDSPATRPLSGPPGASESDPLHTFSAPTLGRHALIEQPQYSIHIWL